MNTKDLGEIKQSPADPQRQGPGHEPHFMFAWRCSSIYMLHLLVTSFTDEDVLFKYSYEIDELLSKTHGDNAT